MIKNQIKIFSTCRLQFTPSKGKKFSFSFSASLRRAMLHGHIYFYFICSEMFIDWHVHIKCYSFCDILGTFLCASTHIYSIQRHAHTTHMWTIEKRWIECGQKGHSENDEINKTPSKKTVNQEEEKSFKTCKRKQSR